MFAHSLKSFFRGGKKKPIVNAHKVPTARKRAVLGIELLEERLAPAAAFTPGDLLVYRVGDATNTAANVSAAVSVYLDEYSPTGTLVQSIQLPGTTSTTAVTGVVGTPAPGLTLTDSGKASSAGQISLSADNSSVDLFGYDVAVGAASATGSATETAGIVSANGVFDLAKFTDQTGQNARSSVYDPATGKLYTSGKLGLFESTFNANGTPTATSIVSASTGNVQIVGGKVYYSSGTNIFTVGAEPTVATTPTSLGLSGLGSPTQFAFARLGTGATYDTTGADTLYVADTTATNGTLFKFTWDGSNWNAAGSIAGPDAGAGNQVQGVTVVGGTVYFTEGNTGSGAVGDIYKFTDAFGTNLTTTPPSPSRIVNVTSNENFRGIVAVPTSLGTNLADWTFETSQPTTAGPFQAEAGTEANSSSAVATGFHSGTTTYSNPAGNGSSHSFSSTNWLTTGSLADYYQFQVSTTGFQNISISFDQTSSTTGPGNFELEYSTDGTTFTNVTPYNLLPNSNPAAWSGATATAIDSFTFDLNSITALNNQGTVFFRLVDNSTSTPSGGTVASGGTDRVDNVVIYATQLSVAGPVITTQPSNASVASGANTSFSAAASGSPTPTIQWQVSTDGGTTYTAVTNGGVYSGATTGTLTITGATLAMNGNEYEAVFTNSQGSATTNPATLTVAANATTTTLNSVSPPSTGFGNAVNFSGTVTGSSPTGTVEIHDGSISGALLGSGTLSSGAFSITSSSTLPIGGYQAIAFYLGDANNGASNSGAPGTTLTITTDSTTTAVTNISPSTGAYGSMFTFTAAVTDNGNSGLTPTGTIQFKDATTGTVFGTAALSGSGATATATFTTDNLNNVPPVGSYSNIVAVYTSTNGNVEGSTSAAFSGTLTVNPYTVPVTLGAGDIAFTGFYGNNGSSTNERFSFVVLKAMAAGSQVIFTDNGYTGAALNTNEGIYAVTFGNAVAAGTQFYYEANINAAGAFHNTDGSTTGLTSTIIGNTGFSNSQDNLFAIQGSLQAPTFITAISALGFITTGSPTTNNTFLPGTLSVGSTAITFNYNGTGNGNGVLDPTMTGNPISGTESQIDSTVNNVNNWNILLGTTDNSPVPPAVTFNLSTSLSTSTTITSISPTSIQLGNPVTFQASVANTSSSATPTGTVQFVSGSTILATGTLSGSGATATVSVTSSSIPAGTYSNIAAVYIPTGTFAGSTSPAFSSSLTVVGSGFIAGDIAVWEGAASTSNTSLSIVDLNPTAANQPNPDVISINGTTGPNALRVSASANTTGYLADTNDGTLLAFTGANTTSTSGNVNAVTARGVGTLDATGAFTLQTTYTGVSGEQTRGATSVDDSTWYIADQTGLYTNSATAASPAGNIRDTRSFGGVVYVGSANLSSTVSTINSPTGGTFTGLPGIGAMSDFRDFYMVSSGQNGPAFDVLYIIRMTNATVGEIDKFSLVGGTWTANGTYSTTFGGGGLAAVWNGTGTNLYATTGDDVTGNNSVVELTDTAGYNSAINVTAAPVTLYTATGGAVLKGVALAPLAATTISFTASPQSAAPGANVTLTANVSSPNAPGGINTGTVYFIDTSTGMNFSASVVNGVATFSTTSLSLGQHSFYAYYTGATTIADATSVAKVVAVTGIAVSSTSLAAPTPNPSTAGAPVTLAATVTGGSGTATGSVEFFDGSTSLGTAALSGGTATLQVTTLAVGTHANITADYYGDGVFMGSNAAAVSETVNPGATITVTAPSNGQTTPGASVTFTATVTGNGLGQNGSPTGTVQFFEDGSLTPFATGALSGSGNVLTATGALTGITAGGHLITATYKPDGASQYATVSTGNPPTIETAQKAFTPGDLVVLRRPNNPSNAAQLVYLDEYTPSGSLVQTIILPDVDNAATNTHIVALSGHASTEGALVRSADGSVLSVFGFDLAIGTPAATSTSSSTTPRSVAIISQSGAIDTSTALTIPGDDALGNARGAVTVDGKEVWVVGNASSTNSGIQFAADGTVGTPTKVGPNNVEANAAEILGGQLYVSTPNQTAGVDDVIDQVGSGTPTGASTLAALPGLGAAYQSANLFSPPGAPSTITPNPYGFLLFNHLTGTSVNPDTLYIADQTYGLLKFANTTEVNGDPTTGTWLFESQKLNNNNAIEGLTGYEMNPGASGYSFVLYATAAISTGNPGNQLVSFTDTNAFNAPNAGGLFNVLATAANSTDTFSGLAFAPLDLTTTAASAISTTFGPSESTTLTATVVDTNNTDSPSGVVTFFVDGVQVGTGTLSTNPGTTETASFTFHPTTPLAVGVHTITASYGGDANDGTSSSSPANLNVNYTPGDVIVTTVGTDATVGSIASITEAGTTATVTTSAPNTLVSGQTVTLSGVTPTGYNSVGTSTYTVAVTSPTTFTITATAGLGTAGAGGTINLGLNGNATTTTLEDFNGSTLNAANTVSLSAPGATATISGIAESGTTATVTTTAAHGFVVGEEVTISGSSVAGYNTTFTIASVSTPTTFTVTATTGLGAATGGVAAITNNLAEVGTTKGAGFLADSLDGHSLTLAGYNANANASTSSANRDVGVIGADGSVNLSTQLSSSTGTVSAAISADGQGFYVNTSTGVRYVSFGGTTPSAISAATWASTNGGTATITAPNSYIAGQTVVIAGITGTTGTSFNGTFVITAASATQFSYSLATQPTGTATFTGLPTSQLLPTLVTNEFPSTQEPNAIAIGTNANTASGEQLYATAGAQFQNDGVPSIDGPALIGNGLPESAGQSLTVLGNGAGQNFPNATDHFGNFPTSNQIAISPDGQTIFVADSRTDGLGGILEYTQSVQGSWVLLGRLQVDNFGITNASETGTTVTVTTSAPTDYFVGESVTVAGLVNTAYDGAFTVTGVSSSGFTYTDTFTNLPTTTPGIFGASATSADGGFFSLVANFNGSAPVLYATTSNVSGNRLLEITGGTTNQATPSFADIVLATAAPNTAFRGVALAPTAVGTTASTTSLTVSPSSSNYASGVTLTATVTSGATGWVSFDTMINGVETEIGAAQINGGMATLNTAGDLPPGSYTITAVYTGDSTFAGSTSSAQSATITKASTTTTLTFSPSTVGTAQSDVLTAIINVPAGVAPTGFVTFSDSLAGYSATATVSQVVLNVNGTPVIAFEATTVLPAGTFTSGTDTITATYSGDGYFSGSSTSNTLTVVNSTTTTVTSNLADPTASTGQALTLSATVTPPTGSGTPGGTVQFFDDTLALGGPVTLNGSGVATLTVNTSLVQSVTITSASANSSGVATITTDANNPMTVGESVTIEGIATSAFDGTFTVTGVSGDTFTYNGQFHSATTDTKGGLAIGLNVLTPGLHSISAVYTPTGSSLSSFANSTGVLEQSVAGQAFGATDVFQERNGDGITPLNTRAPNPVNGSVGVTIYIDEMTPAGTLVQSFILPTADSQAFSILTASESGTTVSIATTSPNNFVVGQLVTIAGITPSGYDGTFAVTGVSGNTFTYTAASGLGTATLTNAAATGVVHAVVGDGQQSTTGQMTLSGDGQDLFLTGYDNNPLPFGTALPVPTGTGSQNVPRSIAQISFNGTVATEAFNTNMSLNSSASAIFDGVYSPDGNQFYISGFNGVYYFPSLTQSANLQGSNAANQIINSATNVVGLESFGGNLYAIGGGSTTASSTRIQQIGVGLPVADEAIITGASWASSVATITANNNYVVGQSVVVAGITGATGFNGTFTITAASSTQFTYALATQPTGTAGFAAATASLQAAVTQLPGIPVNNSTQQVPVFFPVDAYLTHTNGVGTTLDTIYISDDGKSFGAGAITKWSLVSDNITSITESGTVATVMLSTPSLGLVAGEAVNITISGSSTPGYNGTFAATVTSPTTFTFTAVSGLGTATTPGTASAFVENGAISYSDAVQQLGFYWLAGVTNPTTDAVTLYSTYGNGGNADFGPGITYSVTDSNGYNNAPGIPITAAIWSGEIATITAANTFVAGQFVTVTGVTGATGFNGLFTILTANATSFTYALSSNPGTAAVTGAYAVSLNTVDTVAFEGTGGGFAGNETIRGVALAPQAQTAVLVDNGPIPSTTAQAITLTVTIASPGSINIPTGTVTLEDASNGNAVVPTTGGTLSGGTATLTVAAGALSAGTHNLFVVYNGDAYHQAENSNTVSQVVNASLTTTATTLTASPNPSVIGSSVSFVVTVSPATATGMVTLEDASNSNAVVGTGTLSSGTVTISVSGLSIGTHNIFAVYGGDATDLGSQSAQVAQVVNPIQVSSVVVNGDYIPITGASLSGGIVTLTTDGNNGFTAGNQIVIAGYTGTSAGYNGTYAILSASGNQVTYADSNGGMPTLTFNSVGFAISANTTSSLNPGGPNGGHQRSMVDSIVYNFDTPVDLAGGAIALGLQTGVTVTGTATLSTAVPNETLTELNGGMTWVVTFGSATGNTVVGHSIADGVYTINLNSADVTAVSGGSVMTTTRTTDTFYRLYGDENADHHVNSTDALQFANADGKNNGLTGYLAYFDENADGRINSTDALQFANRDSAFWSGFTPTI